jgi:hypothetical protein
MRRVGASGGSRGPACASEIALGRVVDHGRILGHILVHILVLGFVLGLALVGCASTPVPVDRTGGLELELFWTSADRTRASYFDVSRDGTFASSGGVDARARTATFRTPLGEEDLARFASLMRAAAYAERPPRSGADGDLHEVVVKESGRSFRFDVRGSDAPIDALVGFCREISMRQFRDVIDSQPQAGERRR